MSTRVRGTRLAVASLLTFAAAAGALTILHRDTRPRYSLSAAMAIRAARADREDAAFLAVYPAHRARVIPLDSRLQRVTFFAGARDVLDAAVSPSGKVLAREKHVPGAPQSGAALANRSWMLALLGALFLLAVAVRPLRSARNLDALALAAFAVDVVLVNDGLIADSVLVSFPLLAYLAARCLHRALRPGLRGPAAPAQQSLLESLLARVRDGGGLRLGRIAAVAALVGFLVITLTSNGESDVAAASLSGATDLLHGVPPYGHIIAGVVHGDTYPLLNYALYLPGALLHPVTEVWSDLSGALAVAAAAAVAVTGALVVLARRLAPESRLAPCRAALAWLCFAPALLSASGGSNDLVLAALLAWALVLFERAPRSLLLLAAAAWAKVVPLILLPLWLCERRRRSLRALLPAALLTVALLGWLLALGGTGAPKAMIEAISFQFQRGSFYAPWWTFSLQWLQPLAQAALLGVLVWLLGRGVSEPALLRDPTRLAGAGGALLLGLQMSGNYWTWSYLAWVFPFIAVALLMDDRRGRQGASASHVDVEPDVSAPGRRALQTA